MGFWVPIKTDVSPSETILWFSDYGINVMIRVALDF